MGEDEQKAFQILSKTGNYKSQSLNSTNDAFDNRHSDQRFKDLLLHIRLP
jgi:hypothetical protein